MVLMKMALDCEVPASLAFSSNKEMGNMGCEDDHSMSDYEVSLQSRSNSGEAQVKDEAFVFTIGNKERPAYPVNVHGTPINVLIDIGST